MQPQRLFGHAGGHRHGHRRAERQPRQRLWARRRTPLAALLPLQRHPHLRQRLRYGGRLRSRCCGEHNDNTFAFVAALAFGPETAWATEDEPGACYYYDNKEEILALIEELAQEVDVVAVELQFEEAYEPYPLPRQVEEFRELRAAGADIVTGVQSHVPQAMEPYGEQDPGGPGVIVYGLGNLFFDQMWSWDDAHRPHRPPHDLRRTRDQHRGADDRAGGFRTAALGDGRRARRRSCAASSTQRRPVRPQK